MASVKLTAEMKAELARLALIPDSAIDTSDAPEVTDWSSARRSAFFEGSILAKDYDVRAIANWFLDRLELLQLKASNLELNKIVYFAIERALIEKSILLTPARIEAWTHGPVFREIYHAFKGNDKDPITDRIKSFSVRERKMLLSRAEFAQDDITFFEGIVDFYGTMTGSRLRNVSHLNGGPWDAVWNRKGRMNPGMEISSTIILRKAPANRIK